MTNAPLLSLELVPNRELQRRCQEFERKSSGSGSCRRSAGHRPGPHDETSM